MSKIKKYLASVMLGVTAVSAVAVPTMASTVSYRSRDGKGGTETVHKTYIDDKTGKTTCLEIDTLWIKEGIVRGERQFSNGRHQKGTGYDWNHIEWHDVKD